MKKVLLLALAMFLAVPTFAQANTGSQSEQSGSSDPYITREVRHQLVMLPYYTLFDNLEYKVNDGTVTLLGEVTRPSLKSSAENVVKSIKGVNKVENHIKVLPPSPMDDRIREAEYRAIYGAPQLFKYAWGAVPPIHIIVDNGHVTLTGVVDNTADKNVAEIKAKGVAGVFSVTNNLRIGNQGSKE